ncbi:MAG: DUF4136 domain-containing protein, partial [Shewanella sp.]
MKKIIIGLAVLALSACSSLQSDWDYDPSAQFGQYK